MLFFDHKLTEEEIETIKKEFGSYVKITADLGSNRVVVGPILHADGEKILLEKGGSQDNIWGGGIDLNDKIIDTMAVLNLRPRLKNDSMEILDGEKRNKFIELVKNIFRELWH